jgi:hypothetical protein
MQISILFYFEFAFNKNKNNIILFLIPSSFSIFSPVVWMQSRGPLGTYMQQMKKTNDDERYCTHYCLTQDERTCFFKGEITKTTTNNMLFVVVT